MFTICFRPMRIYNPHLSQGIEYIVNKCVQNRPDKRYQNVNELLYDLKNIYVFNESYKKQKRDKFIKIPQRCY